MITRLHLNKKRKTRGFTLIEVLVGAACGVLLLLSLVMLFKGGMRFFKAEEGRTSALQNVLLAYDHIQHDIRRAVYYPQRLLDDSVIIEDGGKTLILSIFDSAEPPAPPDGLPKINVKTVKYYMKDTGKPGVSALCREEEGIERVYHEIKLRGIIFKINRLDMSDEGMLSFLRMFIKVYSPNEKFDKIVFPFNFVMEPETFHLRDKSWQSGF